MEIQISEIADRLEGEDSGGRQGKHTILGALGGAGASCEVTFKQSFEGSQSAGGSGQHGIGEATMRT
jgi:hypothetical protein